MYHRAGLAVLRDGRLLMVRKTGTEYWAIPGGHVEGGESVRQALERELQEELCVDLADEGFQALGTFMERAADSDEGFRLSLCAGEIVGTPSPSAEIAEYVWYDGTLPHGELPPMFVNHVRPALVRRLGWQAARDQ